MPAADNVQAFEGVQYQQDDWQLGPKELTDKHYREAIPYNKLEQFARTQYIVAPKHKIQQLKGRATQEQSGPQGHIKPYTLIDDPSYWYRKDFANNQDYIYYLSQSDITELKDAIKRVEDLGIAIENIKKTDFILPTLGPKLEAIREEVQRGRGFQLIKGVPVRDLTRKQLVTAYWGIGLFWGNFTSQNRKGHYVGHIKNLGASADHPETRVYLTNLAQPFHTDPCDLVSLLCIRPALEGGNSSWASSVTVHNELLKLGRQDLVEVLCNDFWIDRKGEIPQGKVPYYPTPVFSYYKGFFQTAYSATYYELAQRHKEVPRLTEKQREALQWFNSLAQTEELRMDYILEEGDIQLLNNFTMLHNRTSYKDPEDLDQRRHLLRLNLAPENERELPKQYDDYFGDRTIGNRGGIIIPGVNYNRAPLEAE